MLAFALQNAHAVEEEHDRERIVCGLLGECLGQRRPEVCAGPHDVGDPHPRVQHRCGNEGAVQAVSVGNDEKDLIKIDAFFFC